MTGMKWMLTGAASLAALAAGAPASPAFAQDEAASDEIVVRGIRRSLQESLETKRNADTLVDAVTAEDIGKFPDKNVAESLSRVPGVVINREFGEGERVSLRGLAPNQTKTLLNGHAVATADWFVLDQLSATRNFNYLVLPSEIVGQLQVHKSPRADMEEGGIGGAVNVITRKPLDLRPFEAALTAEAAYTARSDSVDPQISGILSWKNESETFGILAAGVFQQRAVRRDGFEILGYDPGLDPAGLDRQVPTLIGSALFQQERERKGGNVEIQFRPSDALEVNISGLWTRFGADNVNANYLAWASNALGAGAGLTGETVIEDTIVAGTIANPGPGGRGAVYDTISRIAHAETRLLAGDVVYSPNEDWSLHLKVGYTDAEGDTDSQPFVEFAAPTGVVFDLTGAAPRVSFPDIDPTDPNDMLFDFASNHQITNDDSEFFVYADAEKAVDAGAFRTLKFGVKFTDHERRTDFQATTFGGFFLPFLATGCNGGPCDAAFFSPGGTPDDFLKNIAVSGSLTDFFLPDQDIINDAILSFGPAFDRIPLYSEIFSVEEKTYGGYVMGDLEGDRWRGNIGVRVVATDQTSSGFIQNATGPGQVSNAFGVFLPVTEKRSYTDILPSANFVYDVTDTFLVRIAAARTLTRPDFTDIAPRVTLNPGALTGSGGNPDVKPFRANQYDVSLEWYPRENTLLALAFYYKDILNFVTSTITEEVFPIETQTPNLSRCTPAGGSNPDLFNCEFAINRRASGGGGRVQGIEAIAQTPLGHGFGVRLNYSFSDAEAENGDPIPGNSRHAFQASGYFENEWLSAQLSYNWRDEFFITFDRASPLNQKALASLDASMSVQVTDYAALTFNAVNLTNEKIEQFAGETFRPRAIYDNGRYFFGGVRLAF
ncbi:TonB-dependent receptor [Amphiplicatus metriothermophilus]|uniref:Iron complex outermembrane recepter protein n=1 Tax=Amphiplicatus metriothermophilus TaxID=1519374 RepID=A0A239PPP4_9PROT|nr:TonB-dependent receptor [Amphiplicatus metriothermophilus]MBB5518735.1 iron complex outermembrane receptor protein [Amphiplicatus metriothermophilus]SNT72108.1 iron complex outermembrane recepter protein [Amphiplicatus metriothermophilus]